MGIPGFLRGITEGRDCVWVDMILVTEGLDKCVMAVEIEKSSSIACKSGRATCGFK